MSQGFLQRVLVRYFRGKEMILRNQSSDKCFSIVFTSARSLSKTSRISFPLLLIPCVYIWRFCTIFAFPNLNATKIARKFRRCPLLAHKGVAAKLPANLIAGSLFRSSDSKRVVLYPSTKNRTMTSAFRFNECM